MLFGGSGETNPDIFKDVRFYSILNFGHFGEDTRLRPIRVRPIRLWPVGRNRIGRCALCVCSLVCFVCVCLFACGVDFVGGFCVGVGLTVGAGFTPLRWTPLHCSLSLRRRFRSFFPLWGSRRGIVGAVQGRGPPKERFWSHCVKPRRPAAGEGKKRAKFHPTTLRAPTLPAPTFSVFGPPSLGRRACCSCFLVFLGCSWPIPWNTCGRN